jgi:hypothetical protein
MNKVMISLKTENMRWTEYSNLSLKGVFSVRASDDQKNAKPLFDKYSIAKHCLEKKYVFLRCNLSHEKNGIER